MSGRHIHLLCKVKENVPIREECSEDYFGNGKSLCRIDIDVEWMRKNLSFFKKLKEYSKSITKDVIENLSIPGISISFLRIYKNNF